MNGNVVLKSHSASKSCNKYRKRSKKFKKKKVSTDPEALGKAKHLLLTADGRLVIKLIQPRWGLQNPRLHPQKSFLRETWERLLTAPLIYDSGEPGNPSLDRVNHSQLYSIQQ